MKLKILFTALVVATITACTTTDVVTDYNPRSNFSSFQRYQWADDSGADHNISPFIVNHVKTAFQRQLDIGLYKQTDDTKHLNFLARYYVAEAAESIDRAPRLGIGLGNYGRHFGISTSVGIPLGADKINRNIQIIIDLLKPSDQSLSWRGSVLVQLHDNNPEGNMLAIEQAVQDIWAEFPPKK